MIPALVLAVALAAAPQPTPLVYAARIASCHDGDTCAVTLHMGLGLQIEDTLRLAGIQAPEVTGASKAAGLVSRDRLCARVCGKDVVIALQPPNGREKYGRLFGRVYLAGEDIGAWLVAERLAVAWDGSGARP